VLPPVGTTVPPPPAGESDELFDASRLPRFDLEVSPAAIAEINAAELAGDTKHYARARFRYGSETLEDVGIRIKGEATRTAFDVKPALKIKFDAFVAGRSFRGLRRLTLNNLLEDPSGIAERLSYHFFRVVGLPAPRATNALLYVNGAFYGVYVNVESVDKALLRRWFARDGGNLYEEGSEDFLPGREETFELQTNELADDRSDLRAMIAAIAGARDDTLLADLAPVLDTEHFLRFTAAEGIVNQWDMYGYTRFYPNNFHLYHDPTTGKFVFIPWGMDMTWKPINDSGIHLPLLQVAHQENSPAAEITSGLIFRRCLASAPCRARYVAVARELVAALQSSGLEALAVRFRAQIAPHLQADTRKPYSNAESEASYALVLSILRERATRIRAELGP
jgi:spore coat protein CotH